MCSCSSWAAFVTMPSDIGCSDQGYHLPPLHYHEYIVPASRDVVAATGHLFAEPVKTLNAQRAARRGSLPERVEMCAKIANETEEQVLVFCDLNAESDALTKAIRGAVELRGTQTDDEKEGALDAFLSGRARVLVSKPSLAAWGLNMQFCRTVVFCGLSHSFEQMFQAVRRCWRYLQTRDVHVHIVTSELEGEVLRNVKQKHAAYEQAISETRKYVGEYVRNNVRALGRNVAPYDAKVKATLPAWLRSEAS